MNGDATARGKEEALDRVYEYTYTRYTYDYNEEEMFSVIEPVRGMSVR